MSSLKEVYSLDLALSGSAPELARLARKKPLAAGNMFVEIVIDQIKKGLFANVDKATVLSVVGDLYDKYLAKIDIPGEFDALVHGVVRQLVLSLVSVGYDRLTAK